MTIALWSLLAYAVWTIGLLFALFFTRVFLVRSGAARVTDFRADVAHGTDRYRRLMRAHLNCTENLPVFGVVVLVGDQGGIVHPALDVLAVVVVVFRVLQSTVHITSGRGRAVLLRAACFIVQVLCTLGMAGTQIGLWVAAH